MFCVDAAVPDVLLLLTLLNLLILLPLLLLLLFVAGGDEIACAHERLPLFRRRRRQLPSCLHLIYHATGKREKQAVQ